MGLSLSTRCSCCGTVSPPTGSNAIIAPPGAPGSNLSAGGNSKNKEPRKGVGFKDGQEDCMFDPRIGARVKKDKETLAEPEPEFVLNAPKIMCGDMVKLEVRDRDIDSVMLIACYMGDVDLVKWCIEEDVDINHKDLAGFSGGYHAATGGHVEVLKVLVEHDIHREISRYFCDVVTADGMTPLMVVMRLGQTKAYEYMLQKGHCEVKLKGSRYGVGEDDPTGFRAPLHEWLAFLPEISHISQMSKRRPCKLLHRVVGVNSAPTAEDYASAIQRRLIARNVVRLVVSHNADMLARSRPIKPGILQTEQEQEDHICGPPPMEHRGALQIRMSALDTLMAAEGDTRVATRASHAVLPKFDIEAVVVPDVKAKKGGAGDEAVIWMCGDCNKEHHVAITESSIFPCVKCQCRNFVGAIAAEEAQSSDDEGSEWGNDGDDFNDEDTVSEYFKMFRKSVLISLGAQETRHLLRMVKLAKYPAHTVLFNKKTFMENLYILECGTVHLSYGTLASDEEMITVPPSVPGSTHSQVQILDLRSLMEENAGAGRHQSTCTVKSTDCRIFSLPKDKVVEHCGVTELGFIAQSALSKAALKAVPVFKSTFSEFEYVSISDSLVYMEFPEGREIVAINQSLSGIMMIQSGTLVISWPPGAKEKPVTLVISPEKKKVASGEIWQPVMVIGIRMLLFGETSAGSIRVAGGRGVCTGWLMESYACAKHLADTGLVNHLSNGVYVRYLTRSILFNKIGQTDPRLQRMIAYANNHVFEKGADIVIQGGTDNGYFYVMLGGEVAIILNGVEVGRKKADLDRDEIHYFGELAFIDAQKPTATVRAVSEKVRGLKVDHYAVNAAFGSIAKLLAEQGSRKSVLVQGPVTAMTGPKDKKAQQKAKKALEASKEKDTKDPNQAAMEAMKACCRRSWEGNVAEKVGLMTMDRKLAKFDASKHKSTKDKWAKVAKEPVLTAAAKSKARLVAENTPTFV